MINMSYLGNIFKKIRFSIFYIFSLAVSFCLAIYIDGAGINEKLISYYDFIGDILNFSSILTGFLGAIISILTSISRSSPIITRILKNKKAFHQFVLCMAIPFLSGIFTIIWSMLFRVELMNPDNLQFGVPSNIVLLTLTLFFIFSSILMTITIFYIFFKEDSEVGKREKEIFKPTLKEK